MQDLFRLVHTDGKTYGIDIRLNDYYMDTISSAYSHTATHRPQTKQTHKQAGEPSTHTDSQCGEKSETYTYAKNLHRADG